MVQRTFGLKPHIVLSDPGSIAKTFEGTFKPVRIVDLRGREDGSGGT